MLKEFKEFIARGNVFDLAIGIIIGAAFQKIVTSLVEDIITPLISMITGNVNFSDLKVTVGSAVIAYGNFITAIIDFLIMAFVIFLMVKYINKINAKLQDAASTLDKKARKLAKKATKKGETTEEVAPKVEPELTTKVCPFCYTEINIKASRCPHCTSVLEDSKEN